jgi:hypothetical protein
MGQWYRPGTVQSVATGFVPALHLISFVETLVTGELLRGVRAQVPAWSTPLTHSSWNVECATTDETYARRPTTEIEFLIM